jgi:DNA-binding response OmpR family regulator
MLRVAEQHVGSKYVDQVLDSLYVMEMAAKHFFMRAEMGKNAGRKQSEIDEDYRQAAHLAALVAPNRHLTGLELLPKAKAARPDVPIIMITAYGDTETKQKKLEGGAEALLPKPIDFLTLRSEIDMRIERGA